VALQNTGSNAAVTRLVRQFARANYAWNNRYLAEFDLSHDGSSRFGPNSKYGTFPSASLAWRVSDEPILRNRLGPVSDLKLRGSWGRLGNDRIADYLFQQTFNINSGNYNFNNTLASGATPGRLANPDISWETTEQTNVGLDIEMFSNRLTLTGDVYNKLTSGILIAVPVSSLIGYSAPTQNAGSVQNTGWETALNWRHNIGQLNYSVGFNLANNKNRITSLPGGDQISSPYIRRLGEPIDAIFGIEAVGIFQTQAEVAAWAAQNAKTGPGDLKYKDQNGDNKIDALDRVVIGDRFPHYTFGSNMSAQWRSFDASVLFQGVGKQDVFLDGALIEGPTWENFFSTYLLDSWTPQNTTAKWPRFVFRSDHNQNAPGSNSWYVRDGHYVSLKNLNFGYTLPERLVARGGLSTARFYIAGTNVYTWSPLKGIVPPEANPGSTRATYYYQTRNWSIGTSLGF
jgi:TonB-linked SusC/RagA family outer membrane protein